MKDWIITKSRVRHNKIKVITNASDDLSKICNPGISLPKQFNFNKKNVFVYYGTIEKANNCVQIVEAALVLKKRNVKDIKIWIIGDGKEKSLLEKKSVDAELQSILEFHNPVPRHLLFTILKNCHCSLLILKNIEALILFHQISYLIHFL